MDYELRQRGRASIDFLIDLRLRSNELEAPVNAQAAELVGETPVEDYEAMQERVLEGLNEQRDFRMLRLCREWMLDRHGHIAMEAFEDIRDDVTPALDELSSGSCSIEYHNIEPPAYWDGYEFHRSAGGWDGHDYMGFVHGELVHYHMVGRSLAGVLHAQRVAAAQAVPVDNPQSILELGCASGQFTQALAETYPDASITAVDLSLRQLEQTLRRGNEQGFSWQLLQAAAEDTGLPDAQFDLVCSYAMFHELPAAAAEAVLAEMFRLLKPGGALLMADVKSYTAHDQGQLWNADYWNQVVGGDPYWREYATTDFGMLATKTGFTEVGWGGLGDYGYPFVLSARKPNRAADN